jgi:hypothetical protein
MAVTGAEDGSQEYCREVEGYLCRKNDGHLIRIVGPAFDQVCGWSSRGIPLKVVFRGIDRYFDRYYAKGPRRRPVRIEFCEADVLDVFDEWRRAVGLRTAVPASGEAVADAEPAAPSRTSLTAHLDRVVARLTALRAGEERSLDALLDEVVRELDAARAGARGLRGARRDVFLERLRALDRQLIDSVRVHTGPETLRRLEDEAAAQLAPFRQRMAPDVYERTRKACVDRLLRERARLPTITLE